MTTPEITWELLERYLAGKATPLERQTVDHWLAHAGDETIHRFFVDLDRRDPDNKRVHRRAWTQLYFPEMARNTLRFRYQAKVQADVPLPRRRRHPEQAKEMAPEANAELYRRYLKGESTSAAEDQLVEQWLAADATEWRELFATMTYGAPDNEVLHEAEAKVLASAERGESPVLDAYRRAYRRGARIARHSVVALKAAAVIALLLGGAVVWRQARLRARLGTEGTDHTVVALAGRPPVAVSLLDGSQVILSPGSTLRYAIASGAGRREVRLDGEAYFAVHHDASRPFIVHAGDLIAEDLGTEFVVRAYPEDQHGRVVVRKGRVGINGTEIVPGYLGRLDPKGAVAIEPADTANWFAWTRGQLAFNRMLLRDALPKLTRWYGLEFRLAEPSVGNIPLDGDFPQQLTDSTLKKLAVTLGLSITRQGRVLTVYASP